MFTLLTSIMMIVVATVTMALTDDFLTGALNGLGAGALAGAIVFPAMKTPDTLGRALFVAIMFTLGMTAFQVVIYILPLAGGFGGNLTTAFMGSAAPALGQAILRGGAFVILAFLIGFVVGLLTMVPGEVVKGIIIGLLLGAISGGVLNIVFERYNIVLNPVFFYVFVGLITWGLFMSVSGGSEDKSIPKRGKKK